jgi:hypothetical protein
VWSGSDSVRLLRPTWQFHIRLSWKTQGYILANFCAISLNYTGVCPRCGKLKAKNIATVTKNKLAIKSNWHMKGVEPNATCDTVLKNVNNLRRAFRNEMENVIQSKRSWKGEDEVCRPILWYYEMLSCMKRYYFKQFKNSALMFKFFNFFRMFYIDKL